MNVGAPARPIRIVLVDDAQDIRLLLRRALEVHGGMSVVGEAADGDEGIAVASQLQPDVVLLDLAMPGRSGIDALPDLRRACPHASVIMLSAFPASRFEAEALRQGADAYVQKGTPVAELAAMVAELADRHRDRSPARPAPVPEAAAVTVATSPPVAGPRPLSPAVDGPVIAPVTPVAAVTPDGPPPPPPPPPPPGQRQASSLAVRVGAVTLVLVVLLTGSLVRSVQTTHRRDATVRLLDDALIPAVAEAQRWLQALGDEQVAREETALGEPEGPARGAAAQVAQAHALGRLRTVLAPHPALSRRVEQAAAEVAAWHAEVAPAATATGGNMASMGATLASFVRVREVLRSLLVDVDGSARHTTLLAQRQGVGLSRTLGALFVAVILGLLALSLALARWVLGPVRRLGDDVRAVARGDLDHAVHGTGPAELAELGDHVEAMRLRLRAEVTKVSAGRSALADANSELERSNTELGQFAYVASHDLSEPLRVIGGFAQILEEDYGAVLGPEGLQQLQFILNGVGRMRALIDGLLAYSRVGRVVLHDEAVPLADVVAAAADSLGRAFEDVGASLIVDHPLPLAYGDPVQLIQLCQNLLANGLKFRREGRAPVLRVSGVTHEHEVELVVADDGIGIDPTYREKVFGMFQRLHTREAYDGSGIGLALCKRIVERAKGRIWLESAEPTGTVVHVVLPRPAAA